MRKFRSKENDKEKKEAKNADNATDQKTQVTQIISVKSAQQATEINKDTGLDTGRQLVLGKAESASMTRPERD